MTPNAVRGRIECTIAVERHASCPPSNAPVGAYSLTVRHVPVDAFWSISLYDAAGFFPDNGKPVSVNSLTATANDDGSVTVHFGGAEDRPNTLPVVEGWNYLVRLYRPHSEVLDGSWTFPGATADRS